MPKHKITVTFDVPYYGEVEVEAPDKASATYEVQKALSQGKEIAHPIFKGVRMEPDMFNVGMLHVAERVEQAPPVRKQTKKRINKPTFKTDG